MSEFYDHLAQALITEFTYSDKLDDHCKGLYYVEKWNLLGLPEEVLPPAEAIENTAASWAAPTLDKKPDFMEWHRETRRRVREQVVKEVQTDIRETEGERDLHERKLKALDWLRNACTRSARVWESRIDSGKQAVKRHAHSLKGISTSEESRTTLEAIWAQLDREGEELEKQPKRILHTEVGRALKSKERLKRVRRVLEEIPRVRALFEVRLQIYRKVIAHVKSGGDPATLKPQPSVGRHRRVDRSEEVMRTLDVVCNWLDTNPPPTFVGNGGLVNYAVESFDMLTESGTRDRIRETFRQLENEYSNLPTPELGTGTDGQKYLDNEELIRALRDEYRARVIEK